MHSFLLVDLYSQMPYLPEEMRSWQRERALAWMCIFGEVWEVDHSRTPSFRRIGDGDIILGESHTIFFRSWIGCELIFEYPAPGEMYKVADLRRGWSSYEPTEDESDL
jgi:hypothetical protein